MQRVFIIFVMLFVLTGMASLYGHQQAKEYSDLILTVKNCSVYNVGYSDATNAKTSLIGPFMKPENQALVEGLMSSEEKKQANALVFDFYIKAYRSGYNDGSEGKENKAAESLSDLKGRYPKKVQEIETLYDEFYQSDRKKAEKLRVEKPV